MKNPPRRIICLGDSLTLSIGLPELDKWPTQLASLLEQWQPGAFAVYNRGINGATSVAGIERMDAEVGYLLPGLVLVEYGINDAHIRDYRRTPLTGLPEFQSSLKEIHRYVTEKGGEVLFIAAHFPIPDRRPATTPNRYVPGNGKTYEENYAPYRNAVVETARSLRTRVIDIPAALQARGLTSHDLVVEDGLHLSARGNALYAEIVFRALQSP